MCIGLSPIPVMWFLITGILKKTLVPSNEEMYYVTCFRQFITFIRTEDTFMLGHD